MQTFAAIVDGQHLRRMLGVAQRLVEISDRVEGPAVADPAIDRETASWRCGFQALAM